MYRSLRDRLAAFLANDDPLAAVANTGAFLVWSNQPIYPIYVWFLVGSEAWPTFLTWLSTPFFFSVAIVGRRHPLASRVLFWLAGVLNTLVSVKAFGTPTSVAWFLVPCLVIATTFFRAREWKIASGLIVLTAAAGVVVSHLGVPLHVYSDANARALSHLNLCSVCVLSAYLFIAAVRVRWRDREMV